MTVDELIQAGGKVENAPLTADGLLAAGGKVEAPAEEPGILKTIGHKLEQGFFKGNSDELIGGITAATAPTDGSGGWKQPNGSVRHLKDSGDAYRAGRDSERQDLAAMDKSHPAISAVSNIAGDVGSDLVAGALGIPVGSSAYQALAGALSGLGNSDADTKGGVATDALIGGAAGYAMPKVGGAVLRKVGGLQGFFGQKAMTAAADAALDRNKVAQKALRSGLGSLGGEVSAGRNALDVAKEILSSDVATAEHRAAAKAFLESPEAADLLRGVYDNATEAFSRRLGKIDTAKSVLEPLAKAASPEGVNAATDEVLSHPMAPIARFIKNYAARTVPVVAGGWVGGEFDKDGPAGTLAGAGVGAGLGAVMGAPGTAFGNIMRNPAVRHAGWNALDSIAGSAENALSRSAVVRPLTSAVRSRLAEYFAHKKDEEEAQ